MDVYSCVLSSPDPEIRVNFRDRAFCKGKGVLGGGGGGGRGWNGSRIVTRMGIESSVIWQWMGVELYVEWV